MSPTEPRFDDVYSTTSRLGSQVDRSTGVSFRRRSRISKTERRALYEQSPLMATYVDKIVDDAFRTPWSLKGLPPELDESQILKDLQTSLKVDNQLKAAAKWSRVDGGSALALPVFDGMDPAEPMKGGDLLGLPLLTAYECTPYMYDSAFGSPTYQEILSYRVQTEGQATIEVHGSRIIPFEPIRLPIDALRESCSDTLWGPSVMERVYDEIMRDSAAAKFSSSTMYLMSLMYIKLSGWRKLWLSDQEKAGELLAQMRGTLDSMGVGVIDENDEMGAVTQNLTGLYQLLDKLRDRVAAACGIPREILFSESPAGLNAGELSGPQEIWFAQVESFRRDVLTPALERILTIALPSCCGDAWEIEWAPLWTRSEDEIATTAKTWAETDSMNIDRGIYTADEAREHRRDGKMTPVEFEQAEDVEPLDLSLGDIEVPPMSVDETASSQGVAESSLGGPQLVALISILEKVKSGALGRDQGSALIKVAFPSIAESSQELLGAIETESLSQQEPMAIPGDPPGDPVAGPDGPALDEVVIPGVLEDGVHPLTIRPELFGDVGGEDPGPVEQDPQDPDELR